MKVGYHIKYFDEGEPRECFNIDDFPSFVNGWKHWKNHIEWLLSGQKVRVVAGLQTQKKMEIELKMPKVCGSVGTGTIEVVEDGIDHWLGVVGL
jgi:hypothetical protein